MHEQEMLNDLIVESREHLENIEPDLLELEEKKGLVSDELINRVFRAVHSIKGGFGFFGIKNIVQLSHVMENVLAKIRDKTLSISSELTDVLLKGIDKLHILLDDVGNSDSITISDEVEGLSPYLDSLEKEGDKSIASDSVDIVKKLHPEVSDDDFFEAVRNGKYIYQIAVDVEKNIRRNKTSFVKLLESWEKFGGIVHCNPDREILEDEGAKIDEASILFATVLEPDLIGEAVEIPVDQIFTINLTHYQKQSKQHADSATNETAVQADTVQHQKDQPTRQDFKLDTKVEDALRVKINLLNNLMNLAGELVLARNQLIQIVNRRVSESPEIEKSIKECMEILRQSLNDTTFTAAHVNESAIEERNNHIEFQIKELFSFQFREMVGINGIVQNIDMVTTL
ncbi:MAG: Hpt domain-containing protein, partial [Chitinivibrionales bacterium]|nr:Hpt domain-containing protein [Chitinivibrionales bacterium]